MIFPYTINTEPLQTSIQRREHGLKSDCLMVCLHNDECSLMIPYVDTRTWNDLYTSDSRARFFTQFSAVVAEEALLVGSNRLLPGPTADLHH